MIYAGEDIKVGMGYGNMVSRAADAA